MLKEKFCRFIKTFFILNSIFIFSNSFTLYSQTNTKFIVTEDKKQVIKSFDEVIIKKEIVVTKNDTIESILKDNNLPSNPTTLSLIFDLNPNLQSLNFIEESQTLIIPLANPKLDGQFGKDIRFQISNDLIVENVKLQKLFKNIDDKNVYKFSTLNDKQKFKDAIKQSITLTSNLEYAKNSGSSFINREKLVEYAKTLNEVATQTNSSNSPIGTERINQAQELKNQIISSIRNYESAQNDSIKVCIMVKDFHTKKTVDTFKVKYTSRFSFNSFLSNTGQEKVQNPTNINFQKNEFTKILSGDLDGNFILSFPYDSEVCLWAFNSNRNIVSDPRDYCPTINRANTNSNENCNETHFPVTLWVNK